MKQIKKRTHSFIVSLAQHYGANGMEIHVQVKSKETDSIPESFVIHIKDIPQNGSPVAGGMIF